MNPATFMAQAVRLAAQGLGSTYPNPSVGAVVVAGDRIVGRGRTAPVGGPHAEVEALRDAGPAARGATLYVTLEPCCHTGRTGPCTEAIAEAGVRKVVVGVGDPAAHVAGKGIDRLRSLGIAVQAGVLQAECRAVHEHYLHHVTHRVPFVTLKSASSLDGRIAVSSGDSRWITSEASRDHVHRLRAEHHAIAVGVGTVLADDPRLDVRRTEGLSPIPIVFDSKLRLGDPTAPRRGVLRPGTWVLHTPQAPAEARDRVHETGAETLAVTADGAGQVDLAAALQRLGEREIRSVLVEGGGHVLGSMVRGRLWNRWYMFLAPRILGEGPSVVHGVAWDRVAEAPMLRGRKVRRVGPDILWVLEPGPASPAASRAAGRDG